jgi:hypothetical protein
VSEATKRYVPECRNRSQIGIYKKTKSKMYDSQYKRGPTRNKSSGPGYWFDLMRAGSISMDSRSLSEEALGEPSLCFRADH